MRVFANDGSVKEATESIVVADEATDTTCSVAFVTAASGNLVDLGLKTNTALTFNSNTGALGIATIELGHASDTTLARQSAGIVTIEGKTVAISTHLKGVLWGLSSQPDAGAPTTDIEFQPGVAGADDGSALMYLSSVLTKQFDTTWAVGDNAGGMQSGSALPTNGCVLVYLIRRSDTGVVDIQGVPVGTAFAFPSNYDQKHLIWAFATDGSNNIYNYFQSGDDHWFTSAITEISDATITDDAWETATVPHFPPLSTGYFSIQMSNSTEEATQRCGMRPTAAGWSVTCAVIRVSVAGGTTLVGTLIGQTECFVDASQQLEYFARETAGTTTVTIQPRGWRLTGRRG